MPAFILEPDGVLAQLQETRAAQTGGFMVFELSSGAVANLLPVIRAGATAPDEPDTDNDLLPDTWEMHWFTNLFIAGLNTDFDGDGSRDREEYVSGSNPKQVDAGLILQARLAGASLEVSFLGRAAAGPGYQNANRHYRLESIAGVPGPGPWEPVPGFADHTMAAGSPVIVCSIAPDPVGPTFYRARVWLQQKP